MAQPAIPTRLLRLAEAFVFASPRPATWRLLAPFLPAHLSTDDVFAALQAHCAERGVVLVYQAGGWVFRTAPDLNDELQTALGEVRKLPRVALEVLVVVAFHQPITRPEIEAVRGTSLSQSTMELLLEKWADQGAWPPRGAGDADFVGHHAAVPGAVWSAEPARSAWVGRHIRALACAAAWRAAFSR